MTLEQPALPSPETKQPEPNKENPVIKSIVSFKMGKGQTVPDTHADVWKKEYLEFEVKLPNKATEQDLRDALTHAEEIIDSWLTPAYTPGTSAPEHSGTSAPAQENAEGKQGFHYDPEKIHWEQAEGNKGSYELATQRVNQSNIDFSLLKKVLEDNGNQTIWGKTKFYWMITQGPNAGSIGRKQKKAKQ